MNVDSVHIKLSNYVGFGYKYHIAYLYTRNSITTQHTQEFTYNSYVTVIFVGALYSLVLF